MRCLSCEFENLPEAQFCEDCGRKLALACSNCGHEARPMAKFCLACGTPLSGKARGKSQKVKIKGQKAKITTPQPLTPNIQSLAERRQLTVMFCDLVGSTALSTQLDPEELREVMRQYQQTCATVIERYDGHIAQYLGDGLLVYFGYPTAHEDDAARAVRAGWEILTALQCVAPSPFQGEGRGEILVPLPDTPHPRTLPQGARGLHVRLGIHTGLVVVGEMGGGEKREHLALGETPNLAARLQGIAPVDGLVVSEQVRRLAGGVFEYADLGAQDVKGLAQPVRVYRIVGESHATSRFEAATQTGMTPLVGREHEIALLLERWQLAQDGEGQMVLLSGEAGIGKSRILSALWEQLAGQGAQALRFQCSPYHVNSAFYPIIDNLERALKSGRDETPEAKLAALEALVVQQYGRPLTEVRFLAALLSLPYEERYGALTMTPQKQKEETLRAWVDLVEAVACQHPTVLLFEDAHWADPSSLDVLDLLIDRVRTTPLLIVLTHRPEFPSRWSRHSHVTALTLSKLTRAQSGAMIAKLTPEKTLPPELLGQILAKTDGVPLFVEELTKAVVESVGAIHELPLQLGIPATLQDALMARLDRLGAAKEIAQIGAVIGREFSYPLLAAVAAKPTDDLDRALEQLTDSGLAFRRGTPPDATYTFKHALVQDAAYDSLLKSRRQALHGTIARVIEERFPTLKATEPELLAYHLTAAGQAAAAIPFWQQAGERATQRSAYVEAINHLTKGLELLTTLPDTTERTQQELTLHTTLGPALIVTKGFGAPEVEKTYSRARELCQQVGETPQLFQVLRGLWAFYNTRAELQTAGELGEQSLSLAQSVQNPAFLLEAHRALGRNLFDRGEFLLARAHLEQGIALYDPLQHGSHAFLYGYDPGVAGLSCMALVLWHLGYPDEALKRNHEALTLARELAHPFSLAFAFLYDNRLCQFRRDGQTAQEQAEAQIAFSGEHGFPVFVAEGTILRGWALAEQGQQDEGIAQMRQGITAWRATGAEMWQSNFLALLAEAYGKAGQAEAGLNAVSEALAAVDRTGERFYEAELYRLKGELLLQQARQQAERNQKAKVKNS